MDVKQTQQSFASKKEKTTLSRGTRGVEARHQVSVRNDAALGATHVF
jgi:hypothetical protein